MLFRRPVAVVVMKEEQLAIDIPDVGKVSGLLVKPRGMRALLVFGHGAGAGMRHASLHAIAEALDALQIGTLRFQFPYMEAGRSRTDRPEVAIATILAAVAEGGRRSRGKPLFLGGHSFGGRMASLAASRHDLPIEGLVFCSFPLHQPGKPDVARAAHLSEIDKPMLFLSGDRDTMADRETLESVVGKLALARIHWLETGDHGYKILKRTRKNPQSIFEELAGVACAFVEDVIAA